MMDFEEKRIPTENQKFCKHCGEIIDKDCIICPKCGKQVEELKAEQPTVVVNNTNTNTNVNRNINNNAGGRMKNKWTACSSALSERISSMKVRSAWESCTSSLSACSA